MEQHPGKIAQRDVPAVPEDGQLECERAEEEPEGGGDHAESTVVAPSLFLHHPSVEESP